MSGAAAQAFYRDRPAMTVRPSLLISGAYAAFFGLWIVLNRLHPSPAMDAGALAMGLSAVVWLASGVYRLTWTVLHARNRAAILTRAGDPALELEAYRHIVAASSQRLMAVRVVVTFICLPAALLSASLTLTACVLAFAGL